MKISKLPPTVIDRLDAVVQHADVLARAAASAESALSDARDLINGKRRDADHQQLLRAQATFQETLEAAQETRKRADAGRRVATGCKAFVAGLADDAELQLVEPPRANGLDLAGVRAKVAALRAEIHKLKIAPMPSADIEQRVESYVDALGRKPVMVSGIRAGENLDFQFPMSPDASVRGGYVPLNANPLMLAARFHRDALIADLLKAIETEVATPLPPAQRPAKISALESELAALQAIEVMLVSAKIESGDVEISFSPETPVQQVLGIVVADPRRSGANPPVMFTG